MNFPYTGLYSNFIHGNRSDINTVNSEIFARVLFSRNFAYAAKFRENKTLAKWRNHSVIYGYR